MGLGQIWHLMTPNEYCLWGNCASGVVKDRIFGGLGPPPGTRCTKCVLAFTDAVYRRTLEGELHS